MEVSGLVHVPASLSRGKELGEPQSQAEYDGKKKKIPSQPLLGIKPWSSIP